MDDRYHLTQSSKAALYGLVLLAITESVGDATFIFNSKLALGCCLHYIIVSLLSSFYSSPFGCGTVFN